ncbi:hypothetical protein J4Q44_G00237640 [Coregonus suidteri]|uniref:Uncharacterized protein n=1 Tax=Coregonus suidteri TaxID=861788 RepID=A0AAN8QGK0_9TELE
MDTIQWISKRYTDEEAYKGMLISIGMLCRSHVPSSSLTSSMKMSSASTLWTMYVYETVIKTMFFIHIYHKNQGMNSVVCMFC